jgi:hypothetical protein
MSFATNHFIKNMINNAATAPNIDDIAFAYRNIYTYLGFDYKGRGNFITYAYRAHNKMARLKTQSFIRSQVKRH